MVDGGPTGAHFTAIILVRLPAVPRVVTLRQNIVSRAVVSSAAMPVGRPYSTIGSWMPCCRAVSSAIS